MLEYLAHLDEEDAPDDLVLATADVPETVSRLELAELSDLPNRWREYPAPEELEMIGDAFVREAKAAMLIVPSVIVPTEYNWILNPLHPDFRLIAPPVVQPFSFDSRLVRRSIS
jgi:RES domain-containing protein